MVRGSAGGKTTAHGDHADATFLSRPLLILRTLSTTDRLF
jgi:hypothetical protein